MTTDCYIYARVSTSKQVTEGNGLDSQLRRCLNYAKDNNYKVIQTKCEATTKTFTEPYNYNSLVNKKLQVYHMFT